MNILLLQIDGSTPNLALMRIAAHHRRHGNYVELRKCYKPSDAERTLYDPEWDQVYGSAIFERSRKVCESILRTYHGAKIGGTGWDIDAKVSDIGVGEDESPDYSDYPGYRHSIGFSQRGCRLKCSFCVVPRKEGKAVESGSIYEIWRGSPWPKNVLLLDNDFFGVPSWRKRIEELNTGGFKVCWNQGFNVRLIGEEEAAAVATTDYRDNEFKTKRLYTAWDNRKDEDRLFGNLESLVKHGVKPDHIMVYMLVGYWDRGRLTVDDFYRQDRLREFGCRPYPMPYLRTKELVGFQRWVVGAYDKRIPWERWERAGFEPRKLGGIQSA